MLGSAQVLDKTPCKLSWWCNQVHSASLGSITTKSSTCLRLQSLLHEYWADLHLEGWASSSPHCQGLDSQGTGSYGPLLNHQVATGQAATGLPVRSFR